MALTLFKTTTPTPKEPFSFDFGILDTTPGDEKRFRPRFFEIPKVCEAACE